MKFFFADFAKKKYDKTVSCDPLFFLSFVILIFIFLGAKKSSKFASISLDLTQKKRTFDYQSK